MTSVTPSKVQRLIQTLAILCVALLAAGPLSAETPDLDLSGRWEGSKSELTRSKACDGDEAKCDAMTIDVSRCGAAWCGVEVASDGACGAVALRIAAVVKKKEEEGQGPHPRPRFEGTLSLAKSTEPYVVEVSMDTYAAGDEPAEPHLNIIGDTGGEFRFFRRSFPFHSVLSKRGPATCTPEKALSMLQ